MRSVISTTYSTFAKLLLLLSVPLTLGMTLSITGVILLIPTLRLVLHELMFSDCLLTGAENIPEDAQSLDSAVVGAL